MRLRKKKTHLSITEEAMAPARPRFMRAMTFIYAALLIGVVGYVTYYFINAFVQVEGRGRVELEKYYVGAGSEGVVLELLVREREEVTAGQELARLGLNVKEESKPLPTTALERERLRKAREVKMLSDRIRLAEKRLAERRTLLREELGSANIERALELRLAEGPARSPLAREILATEDELAELKSELKHETEYLANLGEIKDPEPEQSPTETVLTAPVDGVVSGVFKGVREFLSEEEVLMGIIPDGAKPVMLARFPVEDMPHLALGRTVELDFPDGQTLQGRIVDAYALSSRIREATWQEGAQEDRVAEVVIKPLQTRDEKFWRIYNTMQIEVRVVHEWLDFSF